MARPRKPDGEKLVPAKTSVSPTCFDALDRLARARDVSLAQIIRERLDDRSFRERKTTIATSS